MKKVEGLDSLKFFGTKISETLEMLYTMGMSTRIVKPKRYFLSLGAGIQSTAMLLAIEEGHLDVPKPEKAIFADTGWEPARVYGHLEQLMETAKTEIVIVAKEENANLGRDLLENDGEEFLDIPAYFKKPTGKVAISLRQCTRYYKIRPIEREIRNTIGMQRIGKLNPVVNYMGISIDEAQRMKDNQNPNIENTYPLVDARWTRSDCEWWLGEYYPHLSPVRSACIGCPYRSDREWLMLDQVEKENAIQVDHALRRKGEYYLHRSGKPLAEVYPELFKGNIEETLYNDECGGYCLI